MCARGKLNEVQTVNQGTAGKSAVTGLLPGETAEVGEEQGTAGH